MNTEITNSNPMQGEKFTLRGRNVSDPGGDTLSILTIMMMQAEEGAGAIATVTLDNLFGTPPRTSGSQTPLADHMCDNL